MATHLRRATPPAATPKPTACTVADFCRRYGISKSSFYRHRASMPATIKIGGGLRITLQDERAWLEQAAQQGRAAA